MGVPVESVAVGKCYVTEIGQIRRVLEAVRAQEAISTGSNASRMALDLPINAGVLGCPSLCMSSGIDLSGAFWLGGPGSYRRMAPGFGQLGANR